VAGRLAGYAAAIARGTVIASLRRDVLTEAFTEAVSSVRDIGAQHSGLRPGIVVDTTLEPGRE